MAARPSEIRAFLLRHAEKHKIRVQEHISENEDGLSHFYSHIQAPIGEPIRSATAVSRESPDNALVMAFLSFSDHRLNFLPDDDTESP